MEDYEGEVGHMNQNEANAAVANARKADKRADKLFEKQTTARALLVKASSVEAGILRVRQERFKLLTQETNKQTLGLTIEGKIHNMGLQRVKAQQGVVDAHEFPGHGREQADSK